MSGIELDIVCSYFGNRVFLFISDLQKLGTLVCESSSVLDTALVTSLPPNLPLPPLPQLDVSCNQMVSGSGAPSYSVRTLLGKDGVSG